MEQNNNDPFTIDLSGCFDNNDTTLTSITVDPNTFIYSHPTWTTTGTSGSWTISDTDLVSPSSAKIQLNGEDADIMIGEKSLMQILDGIEQRLGLLKCREDLESEWEELKALGDQYRELQRKIEEKSQMWETLKKMPKPDIK